MLRYPVLMLLAFAWTLYCSATLLFTVEPMVGKMLLPLLGGAPAVWNTCMVFFQIVLLAGYAYAHFSTSWLGARKQAVLHLVLLAAPFLFLPLGIRSDLVKGSENPISILLLVLTVTIGVPMFVVSASAPLLQKWFASTAHPSAKDPYFLYGASNLGSMAALIAYPLAIEPLLRLQQQSISWTFGYVNLVVWTLICALFLWRSPRSVEAAEKAEEKLSQSEGALSAAIQPGRRSKRKKQTPEPEPPPRTASARQTLSGDVTWLRVLRWVALAFVPSSLMLGATTYITTDLGAHPILWVTPLALYLLSFILVFSRPWLQRLALTVGLLAISVLLAILFWIGADAASNPLIRLMCRGLAVLCIGGLYGTWRSWKSRDDNLLHQVMVLVMPLLILALVFIMLSGLKTEDHWIACSLALHLTTLFVVAMVCHGELARDRPAPQHLTGYYLWMSVGGVIGGLFNGLLAPVLFSGLAEYELAMMLACYLAPPLGAGGESSWGRRTDLILAGLFAGLALLLIPLRLRDHDLSFEVLKNGPWEWELVALILGIAVVVVAALRARGRKDEHQFDRWMDLVLPLCLGLLLIGLSWGLWADIIWRRMDRLADLFHLSSYKLRRVLIYGVPVLLCYTFIERSLRFALGVGAVLLAGSFCSLFDDNVVYQERSFFGVLSVEHQSTHFRDESFVLRRLIHGTTLHGMQLLEEDRHDEPLTYYHRTGPVGGIMLAYNRPDPKTGRLPNLGVIGLGTGTMACYALPGQNVTFYDIDPVVRRLSFEADDAYFSFIEDARRREVHLELLMGDARLTMAKQQLPDSEKYGILIVDAFSSDAIPMHLITREALQVYLDKLSETGLLCFHVSNRYIDLRPVLLNLARDRGLAAIYQNDENEKGRSSTALLGKTSSTWVVLARRSDYLDGLRRLNDWENQRKRLRNELLPLMMWPDNGAGLAAQAMLVRNLLDEEISKRPSKWLELEPNKKWPDLDKVGVWTDDYSNLLSVFWW